jgi:hypothetical protein
VRSLEDLLAKHEQDLFEFNQLDDAEKARYHVIKHKEYANDPLSFLRDCVYTLDQVSADSPIKLFPSHLAYVQFLVRIWEKERLIAVPKSRRMICSWTFISLYLHDTIFNVGRFNGLVSRKEDAASDLVSRAEFIYNKIPEWRIPRQLLPELSGGKMSKQPPTMRFESINSRLQGFPQGADQLRQFTLSGLFGDECAFWEDAQKFYSASKPTLDGGGRMTLISSRAPGFFKKIVFDQIDSLDTSFKEIPPAKVQSPMEGVDVWRNPKNHFTVVDLHYTANPEKRGDEWRENVKRSMPIRDFMMEYERSWQTFEGRAVYADFNKNIHVSKTKVRPEPGIPLLIGVDFGLTPACIIAQLVGRQLRILHEFIEDNGSISKLAPVVMNYLKLNFAPWFAGPDMIYVYIDPAGFQRAQTDERTCADILRSQGFEKIKPGPVAWEQRRRSVEDYLTKTYAEGPGLIIDEEHCPLLIEGFGGGYRYPDNANEIEPSQARPIKNKWSHVHDATQYLASGATQLRKSYKIDLPTPTYSFQTA